MVFTTGTISTCAGGNHLSLPITISGNTRTLNFTMDELRGDPPANLAEAREAILTRLRSAVKEFVTGSPTSLEVQLAINNKTFQV